jgi:hypothetical protein
MRSLDLLLRVSEHLDEASSLFQELHQERLEELSGSIGDQEQDLHEDFFINLQGLRSMVSALRKDIEPQ